MGEMRNAYRVSVGKPYGKRPLGGSRCKWEDNIKMDFRYDWVVWTGFIWLRVGSRVFVNMVIRSGRVISSL
jgi:hypothetical protein